MTAHSRFSYPIYDVIHTKPWITGCTVILRTVFAPHWWNGGYYMNRGISIVIADVQGAAFWHLWIIRRKNHRIEGEFYVCPTHRFPKTAKNDINHLIIDSLITARYRIFKVHRHYLCAKSELFIYETWHSGYCYQQTKLHQESLFFARIKFAFTLYLPWCRRQFAIFGTLLYRD